MAAIQTAALISDERRKGTTLGRIVLNSLGNGVTLTQIIFFSRRIPMLFST